MFARRTDEADDETSRCNHHNTNTKDGLPTISCTSTERSQNVQPHEDTETRRRRSRGRLQTREATSDECNHEEAKIKDSNDYR